jgi:hypothetical protein
MPHQKPSFDRYFELLRLRALGCPVDCENLPRPVQPLRIDTMGSDLKTNLYRMEGGAVFILPVQIYVAAPITVYRYYVRLLWFGSPVSWLTPSDRHPQYYLLPPGLWIHRSFVLNQTLHPDHPLRRDTNYKGLLLGTIPEDIPSSLGKQVLGVLGVEDVAGRQYFFPIDAETRHLDPDLLRTRGEAVTFPPPRVKAPTLPAKPTVPPTVIDKTETWQWKAVEKELHALAASADAMGDRDRWEKNY